MLWASSTTTISRKSSRAQRGYGRYPLAELDVIEVAARTFLGVEYPGLVMIEQGLYEDGNGLAITVAHEVAHQW